MDEEKGIRVEHLYKSFGREEVLSDVSLSVGPGEILGIVGNNGCGKTVLMKCICGFLKPDKGKVFVGGKQIGRELDFPESIGIIIETPGFLPNKTGYENLRILASIKGELFKEDIQEVLKRVGLDPKLKKSVSKYSLGMRQRLGIAQAIMEDPDVLILDEPFNGLDKKGAASMRLLIKELKAMDKAILLASHNTADIEELCDNVRDMEAQDEQSI